MVNVEAVFVFVFMYLMACMMALFVYSLVPVRNEAIKYFFYGQALLCTCLTILFIVFIVENICVMLF